jgi:cytochrome d ubiquinol oxidase subunit I
VALPFYSFRLMIAVGFGLVGLTLWTLWAWRRGDLTAERLPACPRLLSAWVAAAPLTYLAVETGWIVREVGRQPWIIYGIVRTADATSPVPAGAVAASLALCVVLYAGLLAAFVLFARRIFRQGPDAVPPPPALARAGR